MYVPVTAVAAVEGEQPVLFVGRENGVVEKYSNTQDLSAPSLRLDGAHTGCVTALFAVSAEDLYSSSVDGTVCQWNTASEVEGKRETKKVVFPTKPRCFTLAGDVLYVGGQDGNVYVVTGSEQVVWRGHKEAVVHISQLEGIVATASYDNQVRVWEASGKCLFVLVGHTNYVKGVQLLGNNTLMSVSLDETIRLWTLPDPSTLSSGESAPPPKEGEEGVAEGAERSAQPTSNPTVVRAVAVIPFTGVAEAIAVTGSNTFVGTSEGGIIGVNTRDLIKAYQDFQARNISVVRAEKLRVEKERVEKSNKLRLKLRKAIRNKRKELKQQEKDAEAAAAAERLRIARERAAENDEDEPPVDEPPAEEEITDDAPLSAEHEEQLAAFAAAQEQATQAAIEEAKQAAARRIDAVSPIADLVYSTEKASFHRLPFTRHYSASSQSALALACVGKNAFVANGASVAALTVVPGVTVL